MSSRTLAVIVENADFELEGTAPLILAGNQPLSRVEKFCRAYRWRGVAHFFRGSSPVVLHDDLQRSGGAFAFHLSLEKDEAKVTSRAGPFFDAIASGDLDGAREIARLSRMTWNREEEYEDDFLYVVGLMKLCLLGAPAGEMAALVDRYEEVLEGNADPRFDLLKALVAADAAGFEAALTAIVRERADSYRVAVERGEILDEELATDGQLFIEGLALCRLAEERGLPTKPSYKLIPKTARTKASMKHDPDAWRDPMG